MTVFNYLTSLRGRGLLADIDIAFAQLIGRNAAWDPALTLLAALVSNAASMHREIALPVCKIETKESLRGYLKILSAAWNENEALSERESGLLSFDLIDHMDRWPPTPGEYPHLFREYRSEADKDFQPTPLVLANGLYYLGRAFQNELFGNA